MPHASIPVRHAGAPADAPRVVYAHLVESPGAPWMRLKFGDVRFAGAGDQAAFLRITCMLDGDTVAAPGKT